MEGNPLKTIEGIYTELFGWSSDDPRIQQIEVFEAHAFARKFALVAQRYNRLKEESPE